ncbi:MAG: hypothetical protein JSV62_08260 [Promethearchaeota archaeon]|nr:MAG: hypothetical protein JSV62_08260 [Candidatus Lokiarchaeota archaeon]
MTENIDLKSLEKKAYKSTFEDGIWDIFLGLLVLNIGLGPLFSMFINLPEFWDTLIFSIVFCTIAFLIFYLGKKYITVPRIGDVKFGPKRTSKLLKLRIFLSIVFILNVVLFTLPLTGILNYADIQPLLITLILGFGVFTIPFCIVAYFLDFTRLYYYALSIGLGLFLTDLLTPIIGFPFDIIIIFSLLGGIIVIIGLVYFICFLRKYPLSK